MAYEEFPILYTKTSKGQVQQWQIIVDGNTFFTIEGLKDMKLTTSDPTICIEKSVGKANSTTGEEQALKEAKAKFDKKKKTGYSEDESVAGDKSYPQCMLAKKFKDYEHKIKFPVIWEYKLNGNRLLATQDGLFSRKGEKHYEKSVPHILVDLQKFFEKHPNAVLDGECYSERYIDKLNELSTIVATKKQEKITKEFLEKSKEIVEYHIYDVYNINDLSEDDSYEDRMNSLEDEFELFGSSIKLVKMNLANSREELMEEFQKYLDKKGEGLIVRIPGMKYEHKRSSSLLKLKSEDDAEFYITDIQDGSGQWAGKAKIVSLEDKDGSIRKGMTFDACFKGTMEDAIVCLRDKDSWIGRKVTINYNGLTGDNVKNGGGGIPQYAQFNYLNCIPSEKSKDEVED